VKISLCIPNYNYERYLGKTLASALEQLYRDVEVVIADNASTDRSVEIARGLDDPRVRVKVNRANVGFAGNLDRAAGMATGEVMILLSSDDLVRPAALRTYAAFFQHLGDASQRVVVTSTMDVIDPDDAVTGVLGPDRELWTEADRAPELDGVAGGPVYRAPAPELLRRSLLAMKNPFNFAATAYPRSLYETVEGYGGGRLINPDKWFHWRLLGAAETAYFIDHPLFAYRWHPANQSAQQAASGALKHLVDEYSSTLQLEAALLERAGVSREAVERAFVQRDIVDHALATLGRGQRQRARRIVDFGRATYPQHLPGTRRRWLLRALLALGPLGEGLARGAYARRSRSTGRPSEATS